MTEDVPQAVADPREAFRQLSSQHVQAAFRLAWAILGDEAEAQEAAQEAFTSAWRQRFTLHDSGRFDAWFSAILITGCRDRLRRNARRPWAPDVETGPSSTDLSSDAVQRHVLLREIGRLDADHRIVLVLRYWKDMPVGEIASVLGVPSGTVHSRLRRAIGRLRVALEEVR